MLEKEDKMIELVSRRHDFLGRDFSNWEMMVEEI